MNVFAGSGTTGGRRSSGSDNRGQKILLAVLTVVFIALLIYQVPKFVGDDSGGSETPAASETSATEADAAAAAAAAQPSDQAAAASATTAAGTTTAAQRARDVRLERYIKSLPARDPFAPVVPASTAAPATSTPDEEAASAHPPGYTTPSGTTPTPTAAVIWTNGNRQVVGIGEVFKAGNASFRLVSVDGATATVAVVGGAFPGGNRRITLDRARRVTLEDTTTGVRYILRFSAPMALVPEAGTTG